jgi:hypothetical protein
MDYMKPEIIDLDVGTAGGAQCSNGPANFSTGCYPSGFANEVNCNTGALHGNCTTGTGCCFGYGARKNCSFGWGVT